MCVVRRALCYIYNYNQPHLYSFRVEFTLVIEGSSSKMCACVNVCEKLTLKPVFFLILLIRLMLQTGYQQQTIGNDQPNKNLFHFFLCITFQTLNGRPYMDESARHMNIFIHPKIDENANSCVCICLHQILCICIYRLMSRKKGKSKR